MIPRLSKFILDIWGWKMVGPVPEEKKYIIIVAPHTSNWDYVIGQLFFLSRGIKSKIMIKKELFYFPLGKLLGALGGIPVDRDSKTEIVDQMISEFNNRDSFILTLTPEGTRKRVTEWKTGFHRIAMGAKVPVLLGFCDYKKKHVGVGKLLPLTGDLAQDMKSMKNFYKTIHPKYPQKFAADTND